MLTVSQGSLLLDWGQESSRSWSFSFSFLAIARKAVISGVPNGYWYGAHAMDRLNSFREENAERSVCRCASSRSGSGVEDVPPKSKAFRASVAASPVVDTSAECIWMREDCGDMTGLKLEALQLKIAVK